LWSGVLCEHGFAELLLSMAVYSAITMYWIAKHDEFHTLIGNLPESPFAKPRLAETY
jgi:hypothetical protein